MTRGSIVAGLALAVALGGVFVGCREDEGPEPLACDLGLLVVTASTEDYLLVCSQQDVDELASYTSIAGANVVFGFATEEDHTDLYCPEGGDHITSLKQLGCLERIEGAMAISWLDQLESLEGLENLIELDSGHFGWDLKITDNPLLPTCEAEQLVLQLQNAGWTGTPLIENNNDSATCE
jgi:hypothetical protein